MSLRTNIFLTIFSFTRMIGNMEAFFDVLPEMPSVPKLPEMPSVPKLPEVVSAPKLPEIITDPLENIVFTNKCLSHLGCFYTGPPFYHPVYRPISLPPYNLNNMKTKFWLFTPSSPVNSTNGSLITTDIEAFSTSPFVKGLPVKFLIHGYLTTLEDKETDDRYVMKNALLKEGSYNVIIVDWTNSNGRPYIQAVANARVVGAQIAHLINFLQEYAGTDPKDVHLIGHSLGAHISGWAGERTPHLGRISGLDPAGPYFRFGENKIVLDKYDADFVDVIHSDTGNIFFEGLGVREAIGDLDFYPNGGGHQPGCEPTLLNFTVAGINVTAVGDGEGITALLATSCDHNRAVKLYIATIDSSKCLFMGTQCESYEKFQKRECQNGIKVQMGFHAKKDPSIPVGLKYYLETGDKFPFCTGSQKIDPNQNN